MRRLSVSVKWHVGGAIGQRQTGVRRDAASNMRCRPSLGGGVPEWRVDRHRGEQSYRGGDGVLEVGFLRG